MVSFMLENINSTLSIVLLGSFAPAMFSPHWFLKNSIINQEDFDFITNSKDVFVSPAFTMFQTDSFKIRVEQERFTLEGKQTPFTVLVEIFKKIFLGLNTLDVKSYGFNFSSSLRFGKDDFVEFGRALCPRKYFKSFFNNSLDTSDPRNGLLSLSLCSVYGNFLYNFIVSSNRQIKNTIDFKSNFHHENKEGFLIDAVVDDLEMNWKQLLSMHKETVSELVNKDANNGK